MSEFRTVTNTADLAPGEMKLVDLDGEEIAIANVEGEYFAFNNTCLQLGAQGRVVVIAIAVDSQGVTLFSLRIADTEYRVFTVFNDVDGGVFRKAPATDCLKCQIAKMRTLLFLG